MPRSTADAYNPSGSPEAQALQFPVPPSRLRAPYTTAPSPALVVTALIAVRITAVVSAHGDLHEQIAAASRAIARQPDDAALYLARGELYRAHHDTDPRSRDYATALRMDPTLDAARLARGRLLVEARPRQ